VRDDIRDVIVPINRKYPLKELLAACRDYPGVSNARRITFEYVMLDGVNDQKNEIKLENLSFNEKYINRTLAGYGKNSEFIEFTPTKDKSIIVESSLNCVDERSSFQVTLENDEKIELKSWNDFNCDGTSYFKWFNKSQIDKLKTSRIK
jgi:hypothetical protein